MLCFDKVSSIALGVKTSCNEPSTRSSAILSRDEVEVCFHTILDSWRADEHEPKDTRYFEGRVFNSLILSKEAIVKSVLWNVVNTVRISFSHDKCILVGNVFFRRGCEWLAHSTHLEGIFNSHLDVFGEVYVI